MSDHTHHTARRAASALRRSAPALLVFGVLLAKAGSMIAAGMSG